MPRYVCHNTNGEVRTDHFSDAHTSGFNDGALVLRNAKGAVIATFKQSHVIKCTTEPQRSGAKLLTHERASISHWVMQSDAARADLLRMYEANPRTSGPLIRALRAIQELL